MEELDIKEIWKTQKLSTPELREDELETMLRSRSQSIVDKLKKITRVEHVANIVVALGMIAFFIYEKEYSLSAFLVAFMGFIVWYYKRLYNKLQSIQPTADVHVYLIKIHGELKEFIRKYQVSLIIIFTIAFFVGLYYGFKGKPVEERLNSPEFYIRIAVVYVVSLALALFFVYLIYGRWEKKIRRMLKEIEE